MPHQSIIQVNIRCQNYNVYEKKIILFYTVIQIKKKHDYSNGKNILTDLFSNTNGKHKESHISY